MASTTQHVDEFGAVARSAVGDHATAADTLGFAPYVEAVTAFLTSPETVPPLTMSVEGEWGSGKSSFLLQVEQRIAGTSSRERFFEHLPRAWGGEADQGSFWNAVRQARKRQPPTIRFNAWRHDKQDALWAAFALSVARRLRRRIGWSRALRADLYLLTKRLHGVRGLLELVLLVVSSTVLLLSLGALGHHILVHGWAHESSALSHLATSEKTPSLFELLLSSEAKFHNSWIGLLLLSLAGLLKFWNQFKLPISVDLKKYLSTPDYKGHAAFIEDFHEDFARLVNAYAGGDRVYIFIDDLDRCDVPRAAELMQAINLMIADAGNLVFVIGMDREKVAAGLTQKYKDLLPYLPEYAGVQPGPGWLGFGYSYLEKFIQLSFTLPVMADDAALERFLEALVPSAAKPGWKKRMGSYWAPRFRWRTAGSQSAGQGVEELDTAREDVSRPSWFSPAYTGPQPAAASEPANEAARAEERIERLRMKIAADSSGIHAVVRMVSGLFESNPRRLKQFLSTYRLALAVTEAQGILTLAPHPAGVTPQQLGKFVALAMRFPDLREVLSENSDLLYELESQAPGWTNSDKPESPNWRWLRFSSVRNLLSGEASFYRDWDRQSLGGLNTARLMSLLPKAAPEPEKAEPNKEVNVANAPPPPTAMPQQDGAAWTASESETVSKSAPSPKLEGLQGADLAEDEKYEAYLSMLHHIAAEYEDIRKGQKVSLDRTEAMEELLHRIQAFTTGRSPGEILAGQQTMLQIGSEGARITVIAIATAAVDAWNIEWLVDYLREYRSWFEHFWTIQALLLHVGLLSDEAAAEIANILESKMTEIAEDPGRYYQAQKLLRLTTERSGSQSPETVVS